MLVLVDALASYLPVMLLRRLATQRGDALRAAERFPAALLVADISGSTALAERLAERGPAGAEELSRILNAYIGTTIEVVTAHGGDIAKFAGDGLLAVWPGSADAELPELTTRAAQCALSLQEAVGRLPEGIRLAMRVGIGAGTVAAISVGTSERSEFIVVGTPVLETCAAEQQTSPGTVALTPVAHALTAARCLGRPLAHGGVSLDAVRAPLPVQALAAPRCNGLPIDDLQAYAPPAILARLAAGQSEWLAELRQVTVMFVRLPRWTGDGFEAAQAAMCAIQAVLLRYEGTIARFGVDEKGPAVLAAFGLPGLAHPDDAVRAVHAAWEIQRSVRELEARSAIGICTGRAFCGALGNARRREYTIIGDVANVAARLMQAASDEILCGPRAYAAAMTQIAFEPLAPLTVKGRTEPVPVYRPTHPLKLTAQAPTALVGRTAERTLLQQRLDALLDARTGAIVIIEGEAGIGKSRLVAHLAAQAQAARVVTFTGAGDAIEASTPYHAWRPVLAQYFGIEDGADRAAARAQVLARLEAASTSTGADGVPFAELAALLNVVVPLEFAESARTAPMTGQARADNTHDLLVRLLQHAAAQQPLLLIVEDAHWLDSASWALARLVAQRVRPLLLVIATRPLTGSLPTESLPTEYRRLLQMSETQRLRLAVLPSHDALTLVCQRLGVTGLPASLAAFIQERAGGHPFFSEELAYALRDAGVLVNVGGQCHLAPNAGDLRHLQLPETLQGVITSRVDRLTPREQFTLKVASVLGRVFSIATLQAVHPLAGDRHDLLGELQTLASLNLINAEPTSVEGSYQFNHVITQQVVYDLLPYTQRRQLHRSVVAWYERTHAADLSPYYALLAHHCSNAVDLQEPDAELLMKAIAALEQAGEQAVSSYANEEAVRFFADAVRLQSRQSDATTPAACRRRARWQRNMGEAYFRLGKPAQAQEHLVRTLALLGERLPTGGGRMLARLVVETGRQALHRVLPGGGMRGIAAPPGTRLEAARAYELLGLVWLLMMEAVPSLTANLRALNLAEAGGGAGELANSCATIGMSAGVLLGPAVAARYFRLGSATAQRVGNRYALGRVLHMQGLYLVGRGSWADGQRVLEEAADIFDALGDIRWREMVVLTLGNLHQMHRRYDDSIACYEAARRTSAQRGDMQAQTWAAIGTIGALHALGRTQEALERFAEMEIMLANSFEHLSDRSSEFSVYGIRAVAHLRRGETAAARDIAAVTSRIGEQSRFLMYAALPGYTCLAELYLQLWERSCSEAAVDEESVRAAARAVRDLRRFARRFPIAQPQALLWSGLYHWLRHKPSRAQRAWKRSLAAAERLDMTHDQGLAHYEIGRHLPVADRLRERHLGQAAEIFTTIGAQYDLRGVQAALAVGTPPQAPGPVAAVALGSLGRSGS